MEMIRQTDMSVPAAATEIKMAYDDKSIYFYFKCDEPEVKSMKAPQKNRDDSVWDLNCIELFIVPYSEGKNYFHFIAAPSLSGSVSILDARKGNAPSEDLSFSPEWNTSCGFDYEKKNWTLKITIPFSALCVKPPIPGEKWRIGLYRSRVIDGKQEFSAWSPSLCPAYAVPERFGYLAFN